MREPLHGVPASPGVGVGAARLLAVPVSAEEQIPDALRPAEIERAQRALVAAAAELEALAARMRADGNDTDAEIVETGALMACDPGLAAVVQARIADDGLAAPGAIVAACTAQADVLAALPDATLAARADDVRSLGRRAARLAAPAAAPAEAGEGPRASRRRRARHRSSRSGTRAWKRYGPRRDLGALARHPDGGEPGRRRA